MRTDTELQTAVQEELTFDPSVTATDIGVTVDAGIVSLLGTVRSFPEKWAAERAAERVSGVRALAQELKVKLPGEWRRSDVDIARAAADTLKWDVMVPDTELTLEVENGHVTLKGVVDWNYQRVAAVRDCQQLVGVVNVSDVVTLKVHATPSEVKSRIESALARTASRDARKITVEASGDTVTLRGQVHTWRERQDAEQAAWNTPGVRLVQDHISVKP